MSKFWPLALLLVGLLVYCACMPDSQAFVSPLLAGGSVDWSDRVHVPMLLGSEPKKLGLGGCVTSCEPLGCSWCYGWKPDPGSGQDHERVPMIRDAADMGRPVSSNSNWLMGFNEPDLSEQANLTPISAAKLWREIERSHPERRLVAPAPSHIHPDWLPQFRNAYRMLYGVWPRLDALAFHCYFPADSCIGLGEQFVTWALAWGVPEVWCTEFAFVPAYNPRAEEDARRFVAWLEAEPVVARYAPFASYIQGGEWYWPDRRVEANPSIFAVDGVTLTEIGQWYAGGDH